MKNESKRADRPDFSLAYYSGNRKTGTISVIESRQGATTVLPVPSAPESGLDVMRRPVLVGLAENQRVILFDPVSKALSLQECLPADAFPAHIYRDGYSARAWYMNDGDKATGNDTLNFGDRGSSVTVVENVDHSSARFLATICVGRGHHQAAFSHPSDAAPEVPAKAYVSNLKDGTLSVIGNDPEESATYLQMIATIDLLEKDKEQGEGNNAFPHGLAYSSRTGLIYNLNNGYGTIAVIDPKKDEIIDHIAFKGHSNLFVTPDGRYIIGRGADRKSDPDHVIAKLTVLDLSSHEIVATLDLADVYISKYYFSPEGNYLYLTTSSSGSPEQQANLKTDALLIFSLQDLPHLALDKELRLGSPSGSLDFLTTGAGSGYLFSSHSAQGKVLMTTLDGTGDLDSIDAGESLSHSRLWLI